MAGEAELIDSPRANERLYDARLCPFALPRRSRLLLHVFPADCRDKAICLGLPQQNRVYVPVDSKNDAQLGHGFA